MFEICTSILSQNSLKSALDRNSSLSIVHKLFIATGLIDVNPFLYSALALSSMFIYKYGYCFVVPSLKKRIIQNSLEIDKAKIKLFNEDMRSLDLFATSRYEDRDFLIELANDLLE